MKKQLLAVLIGLAPLASQAAGGTWDGIYNCDFRVATSAYNVYITINGQPDGRAIFAIAATTSAMPFFGYGIGAVSGNTFTGSTMLNLPFAVSATSFGFTGTISVRVNNQQLLAAGNCTKVW